MSTSPMSTRPDAVKAESSAPEMKASSVDLPQPLGPISVTHSPGATAMSSAGINARAGSAMQTCSRRSGSVTLAPDLCRARGL